MIAYIKGRVIEKTSSFLILENQGLGYKVFVTPDILEKKIGEPLEIFTYLKVAENEQSLFGLPDFKTLQFFEMLITVSGVGPKMALAILSASRAEAVQSAVANQDVGVFTRISGVGTKTAEKIILELKSKVGKFSSLDSSSGTTGEVFDALIALGYKQGEIRTIIHKLDASKSTGEQIKEALKLLGK
ncbi:MAG: Holliday junction branch migration protein RuvA [Candidatus Doudnabacteria bacterium]|nr:Holliday junction branch migration protein RuvA [Candidatus Doudnabacteria bacterium]